MWSISDVRTRGRESFKANYWNCVLILVVISLLTAVANGLPAIVSSLGSGPSAADINATATQAAALAQPISGAVLVSTAVSLLLRIFLLNPLQVGSAHFFSENIEDSETTLDAFKEGFGDYGRVFVTLLLRDIFIILGCIFFLIPGLVLAYSFRLVPYIVKDEPNLSAMEVIKRSNQLMSGNRWRSFLLDLSFIGWLILTVLTLGLLGVFWTSPYMSSADAALYHELLKD